MPVQPPNKTIADYKEEFRHANGRDIDVQYKAGWFRIGNSKARREHELLELTDSLRKRRQAQK